MPLLTGEWNLNVNGNSALMGIASVNADGLIECRIAFGLPIAQDIRFTGFWNESAQSIFFETASEERPGEGNYRAQFFGYLFNSQGSRPVGADIKWILCGHVSTSITRAFPGLPVNSRRTIFGWYAEIIQVV